MADLWWLQEGWTLTTCARCGSRIWPEGDPDWGFCVSCFEQRHQQRDVYQKPTCDICGKYEAVTGIGEFEVCSPECHDEAERRLAAKLDAESGGESAANDSSESNTTN